MSFEIPQARSNYTFVPKRPYWRIPLVLVLGIAVVTIALSISGSIANNLQATQPNYTAVWIARGTGFVAALLAGWITMSIILEIVDNARTIWTIQGNRLIIDRTRPTSTTTVRLEHMVKCERFRSQVSVKFADGSRYSLSTVDDAEKLYNLLKGYAR